MSGPRKVCSSCAGETSGEPATGNDGPRPGSSENDWCYVQGKQHEYKCTDQATYNASISDILVLIGSYAHSNAGNSSCCLFLDTCLLKFKMRIFF